MAVVTTDELADWLRLSPGSQHGGAEYAERQTLLAQAIAAAESIAATLTGRRFTSPPVQGAVTLTVPAYTRDLLLMDVDLASLASVVHEDGETLGADDVDLELGVPGAGGLEGPPYRLIHRRDGFWRRGRVTAGGSFGWDAFDDTIKQSVLILAANVWQQGKSASGWQFTEEGAVAVRRASPQVAEMLSPYSLGSIR